MRGAICAPGVSVSGGTRWCVQARVVTSHLLGTV
jgi:hypothetical protein